MMNQAWHLSDVMVCMRAEHGLAGLRRRVLTFNARCSGISASWLSRRVLICVKSPALQTIYPCSSVPWVQRVDGTQRQRHRRQPLHACRHNACCRGHFWQRSWHVSCGCGSGSATGSCSWRWRWCTAWARGAPHSRGGQGGAGGVDACATSVYRDEMVN